MMKLKKGRYYRIVNEYGRNWLTIYEGYYYFNRSTYYNFKILNGFYSEPCKQTYSEDYILKTGIKIREVEEWEVPLLLLDKENQKRGRWRVNSYE